ncbi:MAG: hypothetical protein LBP79_00995 [Clostridiales bacterium]|nr:hypothetical protein [Clostridiales bacterium]
MSIFKKLMIMKGITGAPVGTLKYVSNGVSAVVTVNLSRPCADGAVMITRTGAGAGERFGEFRLGGGRTDSFKSLPLSDGGENFAVGIFEDERLTAYASDGRDFAPLEAIKARRVQRYGDGVSGSPDAFNGAEKAFERNGGGNSAKLDALSGVSGNFNGSNAAANNGGNAGKADALSGAEKAVGKQNRNFGANTGAEKTSARKGGGAGANTENAPAQNCGGDGEKSRFDKAKIIEEIKKQLESSNFTGIEDLDVATEEGILELEKRLEAALKNKRETCGQNPGGDGGDGGIAAQENARNGGDDRKTGQNISKSDGENNGKAERNAGSNLEEIKRNIAENGEKAERSVAENDGGSGNEFFEGVLGAAADFAKREGADFYTGIKKHLDEMLALYPAETSLNGLIPGGQFVKINYDGENYYAVGVYGKNGGAEYICYGIPGEFDAKPTGRLKEISRWFPLDFSRRNGRGYWLVFQNAADGSIAVPK